jgi:hypothetical protein
LTPAKEALCNQNASHMVTLQEMGRHPLRCGCGAGYRLAAVSHLLMVLLCH